MSGRGGGSGMRGRGRGGGALGRGGIRLPPSLQQSFYSTSSTSVGSGPLHHGHGVESGEKQRMMGYADTPISSSSQQSTSMNELLTQKRIPGPLFPEMALPIPKKDLSQNERYLINYHRTFFKLIETTTPYHVYVKPISDQIQRYSDKYHQFHGSANVAGKEGCKIRLHDIQTDMSIIPLELMAIYKPEKAKMIKSALTTTNLLELLNLDELEKNESRDFLMMTKSGNADDGGKGTFTRRRGEEESEKNGTAGQLFGNVEEEEGEDEDAYDEEEFEEETDYNMDYFDTGDDYGEYDDGDGGGGGGEEPYY